MKTFTLLFTLLFLFSSCADRGFECSDDKLGIIEEYNRLIELAEGDDAQQAVLIRNRDDKLEGLGC